MARINDYLKRYKTTIDKQVDITSTDLLRRDEWMSPFMPFQPYDDYDLMVLKAKQNKSIAHVVGFGGEIPASKAGDLSIVEGGMIKLAKSHVYTEEDMKLMRKWQENVNGVPDSIKDHYFGSVTALPSVITDTHTVISTEGVSTGKIDFRDEITGMKVEVVYSEDANQFPADLTGGDLWSAPTTGAPVVGLRDHSRYYRRRIGLPAVTAMNETTFDFMIETHEFRRTVAALRNVDASTATSFIVGQDDVDEIFRKYRIPPLLLVDETYEEELPDGSTVEKPFVEDGRYFFLWPDMGERALGPVESNNGQPGIYTFSEEVTKEPPVDRAVGVATGMPMVWDTRKLGGRKVA